MVSFFFFFFFGLYWVFAVTMQDSSVCSQLGLLSSCSARAAHFVVFSCCGAQALVVAARGLLSVGSGVVACGIFLNQGWNRCLLHCKVDS